jgi:hypothetical protein
VIDDMPVPVVNRARSHGLDLIIVNFGDDLSPNSQTVPVRPPGWLGLIQ